MRALCGFPECGRTVHKKGLCLTHARHRDAGKPLAPILSRAARKGPCPGPLCDRMIAVGGLCDGHYRQQCRGQVLRPLRRAVEGDCTFPDCGRPQYGKGLCEAHRRQQRKGQELAPIRVNRTGCDEAGCVGKHFGRGFCVIHYRVRFANRRKTPRTPRPPKLKASPRVVSRPVTEPASNLPTGWFTPTIQKQPSNPAGVQKLAADQIGLPVGVTDDMRRAAMRATAIQARDAAELADLLDMIFNIEPTKQEVA